jgi:hypothetical protein
MDKIEEDGTTPHTSLVAKLVPIPKVLRNKSPIFRKMGFLFCPERQKWFSYAFFCLFRMRF